MLVVLIDKCNYNTSEDFTYIIYICMGPEPNDILVLGGPKHLEHLKKNQLCRVFLPVMSFSISISTLCTNYNFILS